MIARQLDAVIIPLSPVVDMTWLPALAAKAFLDAATEAAPDAICRMNAIFCAKRLYPELGLYDVNIAPKPTWALGGYTRPMGRSKYRGWKLSNT